VPPAALSPEELSLSVSLAPVVLVEGVLVVGAVEVVAVVEVEVVSAASFSAEVSFGGVISGVLFGVTSETLVPPQEASEKAEMSISALAASATMPEREVYLLTRRADPFAGRR
jgi:hypothetical protein